MTSVTIESHVPSRTAPLHLLVAVHGHEPPGWADETCRLVSSWMPSSVRVLAVLDVPSPPFTSLIGAARNAYAAARAQWSQAERARLQDAIDTLSPGLPAGAQVTLMPASRGRIALAIADAARAWPADVVIVGAPAPGRRSRLGPGPVHEHLLRLTRCAVLVTAAPSVTVATSPRRVVRLAGPA